jgi:hypothetical protein
MPGQTLFYQWMQKQPGFAEKVARAREFRGQARVARADDLVADIIAGKLDPNAGRIAVQHEQWAASREASRTYGDRLDARLANSDGSPLQLPDVNAAVAALLAALPSLAPTALPPPQVLDAEAAPVPAEVATEPEVVPAPVEIEADPYAEPGEVGFAPVYERGRP